jgi:hypothetical protein
MVNPPEAGFILRGSGPLSYLAYEDSQHMLQPMRGEAGPVPPQLQSGGKGRCWGACVPGIVLGSRRARKGWSETATYRTTQ